METVPQTMVGDAGLLGSLPQLQSPVSFRPALRQLHRQRRETAALRELWHSLAVKRERRLQELKAKACPAVSQEDIPTVLEQPAKKHTPQVNESVQEPTTIRQDESFTKSALQVDTDSEAKITADTEQPLPAIRSISKTDVSAAFSPLRPYRSAAAVPTLRSKTSQERNTASRFQRSKVTSSSHHFRHDDVKSPVPYHTAITRRPERTCSPRFQALTQVCSTPLPHLMEGGVPKSQTPKPGPDGSKRDIREWQNEIVKVVPARPEFFQRLPNGFKPSKVMTFRYPYKVINIDPSCLFYRSYSKIRDKEYVISPEWSSEKHPLRAGIATRARTDLCLRHDVKRK